MLTVCLCLRPWLDRYTIIVASTVYSFLRILEDHHAPHLATLRQKEVSLVVTLLREKFQVSGVATSRESAYYGYVRVYQCFRFDFYFNIEHVLIVCVCVLQECLVIGRDLVRLLQNVARIPEIEAFWKDLLHNPSSLAPNFQGEWCGGWDTALYDYQQ